MKRFPTTDTHSLEELENILSDEEALLQESLEKIRYKGNYEKFKIGVTDEEKATRKRFVCTVIREIYDKTDDEYIKKLALEVGIHVKRMTTALADYKYKELTGKTVTYD